MSEPDDKDKNGPDVEKFELKNRLKEKLDMDHRGKHVEGQIAPDAVEEADRLIADMCANSHENLSEQLALLKEHWDEMKDMPDSGERDGVAQQVFTVAHEIKDIGAMCGYQLAAYFGESLRDFIGQTDLKLEAQRVIIQAHVDVLNIAIKKDIREDDSPAAEELKRMLKLAIDQYS